MAESTSQANRLAEVTTAIAGEVLLFQRLAMTEEVSSLFSMQVDLLSDRDKASSVKPEQVLGKPLTIKMQLPNTSQKRYFNGVVSRFTVGETDARFAHFRAEVVPWLWLLTQTSNCRIFQDQTIPEIVKKVLNKCKEKFPDLVNFEDKTSGEFTKLDYCVQYRESDFNFVSRLLEHEGIFYFFKHEDGKHTLVLANDPSAYVDCPNQANARYYPEAGMGEWEDGILDWEHRQSLVPGKFVHRDYHFQMPSKTLEASEDGTVKVGNNSSLEVYDFPGEYAQRFNKPDQRLDKVENHSRDMAKWRMEERSAPHLILSGTGTCRPFTTGTTFALADRNGSPIPVPGTQGKYVLTSIRHFVEQSPAYISGDTSAAPYRNNFNCLPKEVPFRPARTTPRPAVQGVQTAVVVGLSGEEIDCDKYGRVKVQFHWDREGKKDENSSCWIRVGTPWAGKQWGMIHIPRIGQEVIVAFLEGDPDQPIIVGSVYNYDEMPPYKLPDNKTQSGVKSRSSKDGGDDNFNEIRFEDKKDEEQIYVHAEKNMDIVVENDETRKVGFDKKDKGDQTVEIFNNQTLKVGTPQCQDGSQKVEIWKDRSATLKQGNDTLEIKMGNQTTKLSLGKSETEAMQSIELKVGQNSIKIDQTGITIKGMMVKIEGSLMTDVKGLMTNVKGDGMLQVRGGVAMIN